MIWYSWTLPAPASVASPARTRKRAFYGVDPDAHAFAEFIVAYLTKYGRWNSPKYLFGESYGTPRSAVLVNLLESEYYLDLNGVIMLSQILNFDLSVDDRKTIPESNCPTYWHCRLMRPPPGIITSCPARILPPRSNLSSRKWRSSP